VSDGIKVLFGVIGGVLLLVVFLVAFGGGMMGQGGGMMGQGGWGAWGLLGMLVPLLFLGGLIALIAWVVVQLTSSRRDESTPGTREDSAEEILRQRFARGEIDAEEYEERRRILGGGA